MTILPKPQDAEERAYEERILTVSILLLQKLLGIDHVGGDMFDSVPKGEVVLLQVSAGQAKSQVFHLLNLTSKLIVIKLNDLEGTT